MNQTNRIFISYRRDGGDGMAGRVRDALLQRGYDAFLDVEDLKTGKFNEALLAEIDHCTDFVLILSAGSLDRCINEGDWVRLEIAHALKLKKNIIPVLGRNFHFPPELPADIADVRNYNGIGASHDLFEASITKLTGLLQSRPRSSARGWIFSAVSIALIAGTLVAWWLWPRPVAEPTPPAASPVSSDGESDAESTTSRPLPYAARTLGASDVDQLGADMARAMLAGLGQKRLLYNSQGPLQLILDRVTNNTMQMLETDLVMKKLRADLTASGSIEFSGNSPMIDDLRAINALKNGDKPNDGASTPSRRYVLGLKITQFNELRSTTYTMIGTLSEVATGTEVWRDSVELKKP